jgi:iron complex transport system ATP-binding protein
MSGVEVEGLVVRAGAVELVAGVDLTVAAGTWCTVIGPNGTGKTTLVETVAGLRRIGAGRVRVGGRELTGLGERERARLVSLVPQHPIVPAGMSVREYVGLGRTAHRSLVGAEGPADRAAVASALSRVDLDEMAARDVATLSGGERQRMVVARALAQAAPVMVLDEPTTGLDLRHQVELLELLRREVDECGLTVLATLHDLTLAGQYADRLVLLERGRVALEGPSREVVRDPALARCYGMVLQVVEVAGGDVVVPVRASDPRREA